VYGREQRHREARVEQIAGRLAARRSPSADDARARVCVARAGSIETPAHEWAVRTDTRSGTLE
jgi:hypothetical protein